MPENGGMFKILKSELRILDPIKVTFRCKENDKLYSTYKNSENIVAITS